MRIRCVHWGLAPDGLRCTLPFSPIGSFQRAIKSESKQRIIKVRSEPPIHLHAVLRVSVSPWEEKLEM